MSNEAAQPTTFLMTLAGREIMFREPLLGQVLILDRFARRAARQVRDSTEQDQGHAMMTAIARTLDFIETLVVQEDDRQFIEDKMLEGVIDWQQIMGALSGGKGKDDIPDDQAPAPRKSAPRKATAAKSVASRGRAKR